MRGIFLACLYQIDIGSNNEALDSRPRRSYTARQKAYSHLRFKSENVRKAAFGTRYNNMKASRLPRLILFLDTERSLTVPCRCMGLFA
jgi:hypothetical protein